MSTTLAPWKVLPHRPLTLTAIDDRLSLSLDDFPELPGSDKPILVEEPDAVADQLLAWSEVSDLHSLRVGIDVPVVDELPGEWQQPSEPLF